MSATNIYVLRLKGGKYYVGKSANIEQRLQEHFDGKAAEWTRKYKPQSVLKVIENVSPFEEDKVTKEFMAKYGIENVRGGSYVSEVLHEADYDSLRREIWAATDCCTNCGRKGHFIKDCIARTDIDGNRLEYEEIWECGKCRKEFESEYGCKRHERMCRSYNACYRCGRKGHYASDCYASTTVSGAHIDSSDYDTDDYDSDY